MAQKEYVTVRCVECGRDITTIHTTSGIGTATCDLCLRTAQGLPVPPMSAYANDSEFLAGVARLMGDPELMTGQKKVVAEIPQSIVTRFFDLLPGRRTPTVKDEPRNLPGKSAIEIARERKRPSMF